MKMKKAKILLGVFALSVLASFSSVNAAHYRAFVNLKLGNLSGVYISSPQTKDVESFQYVNTSGATDNLSGDTRAISARTRSNSNTYTSWTSANVKQWATWGAANKSTGSYYLELKATKSTLSTVTYNGIWYIDDTLL